MKIILPFISNTLMNFVIGLLLARFLGPAEYGRMALALAVGQVIQTLMFDWLRLAATRFYSERARRERPELFTSYTPVTATGPASGHAVAYDRGGAITVVTRLPAGLATAGGWGSTVLDLPDGRWHDVLTGLDTDGSLAGLLAVHPVALLVRKD